MAKKKRKRLVILSDFHCGHVAGLTPPDWHDKPPAAPGKGRKRRRGRARFSAVQREMWERYIVMRDRLCPIDALVLNGDAVEGKGKRSGGTEMITTDRVEQTDMAAECIDVWKAPKKIMTYGTPSHTGEDEDWEDVVADNIGAAKIGGHEWIDVNGVVFDFKHKIGSSSIPHGRHTAIARENLISIILEQPEATAHEYGLIVSSSVREAIGTAVHLIDHFRHEDLSERVLLLAMTSLEGSYSIQATLRSVNIEFGKFTKSLLSGFFTPSEADAFKSYRKEQLAKRRSSSPRAFRTFDTTQIPISGVLRQLEPPKPPQEPT